MNKQRIVMLFLVMLLLTVHVSGYAQTIMYVPFDNRPVSAAYAVDTVVKGGFEVLVPPEKELANRTQSANPEVLWEWVFANAKSADSIVVSADALVYGGLVASRTHELSDDVLLERAKNFQKLKDINPRARLYVFSTIMRSPHASSGGVEPAYYETYGPAIFQIFALQDKKELEGLTKEEEHSLNNAIAGVPKEFTNDWLARREKNFKINQQLIQATKNDDFTYLIIGRDDCSPYSRSHQESRWLAKDTEGLSASKYLSFPGADQLGLILLTRAANDLRNIIPSFAIKYTQGVGDKTIPSYQDVQVGRAVREHLFAAGCVPLLSESIADIILAVHTPVDGWTREAGGGNNPYKANPETIEFVKQIKLDLAANRKVALADVAFANGADNSLMGEMAKNNLLPQLQSYNGWNTASNTIGYAIGQAVFAQNMTTEDKNKLLLLRLLDDWAYQANIRRTLLNQVLIPVGHSDVQLNEILPSLEIETKQQMQTFGQQYFPCFPLETLTVSYPWNRMFEVEPKI